MNILVLYILTYHDAINCTDHCFRVANVSLFFGKKFHKNAVLNKIHERTMGVVTSWQRLTITACSTWLFVLCLQGQTIIYTIGRK